VQSYNNGIKLTAWPAVKTLGSLDRSLCPPLAEKKYEHKAFFFQEWWRIEEALSGIYEKHRSIPQANESK